MPRSAEALKRRAAKRNISEEEMRRIDAPAGKRAKKASSEPSPPSTVSKTKKSRDELKKIKKWKCCSCGTLNLQHLCPDKCSNCQQLKNPTKNEKADHHESTTEKVKQNEKAGSASAVWRCGKCNNANSEIHFPNICNRCQRRRIDVENVDDSCASTSCKDEIQDSKNSSSTDCTSLQEKKILRPSDRMELAKEKFWSCKVCKNRNLCSLHDLTCNRCQRHRSVVEDHGTSSRAVVSKSRESGNDKRSVLPFLEDKTSSKFWHCSVCKNRNISEIHIHTCNRCQRHRDAVEEKKPSLSIQDATPSTPPKPNNVWVCEKCKNKNLVSLRQSVCNRCQRPRNSVEGTDNKKVSGNSGKWDTPVADVDLIARNQQLRADFLDPIKNSEMSTEDKERAKVLLERSKRKLEKKANKEAHRKKHKGQKTPHSKN